MTTSLLLRLPQAPLAWTWARSFGTARHLAGALSLVMLCALSYVWALAAGHIEDTVAHRSAAATALYMDSFVEPLVQGIAKKGTLSDTDRAALQELLSPASMGKPLLSFRIWVNDRVVFSDHSDVVGRKFPANRSRDTALLGHVVAKFELDGDDDIQERALNVPILEVYAPIRQTGTGQVIAIAETYELAIELRSEILAAQLATLLVVGSVLFVCIVAMTGLLTRLQTTISELALRHSEGEHMWERISLANGRVIETNERQLHQVGRTLTAGPALSITLALDKLDGFVQSMPATQEESGRAVATIRQDLQKALYEIRNVSAHLTSLEIEGLSLADTIRKAATLHRQRSGTPVGCCHLGKLPQSAPYALKACLFRFLDRTLDHEFRGMEGAQVLVHAIWDEPVMHVEIISAPASTTRPVESIEAYRERSERMRDQVEALGGALTLNLKTGEQWVIGVSFELHDMEAARGQQD